MVVPGPNSELLGAIKAMYSKNFTVDLAARSLKYDSIKHVWTPTSFTRTNVTGLDIDAINPAVTSMSQLLLSGTE